MDASPWLSIHTFFCVGWQNSTLLPCLFCISIYTFINPESTRFLDTVCCVFDRSSSTLLRV